MLPRHIHQLIQDQISSDILTDGTEMRVLQTRAAEKAHFVGQSGNVANFWARGFMAEIEKRIGIVAKSIRTVASEVRIRPYPDLPTDLLAVFQASCDSILGEFRPKLSEALRHAGFPGDGGTEVDIRKYLVEQGTNVKRLAASILEPMQNPGQTIITINNSQVGLLQTGENALNVGPISINQVDMKELLQALESIKTGLSRNEQVNPERRAEVIEIVQEIETEVSRPTPNKAKTGGLITTVLASIRGIVDLDRFATVLMRVAEQLGYSLG